MPTSFSIYTLDHKINDLEDLRDWIQQECPSGIGIKLQNQPPTPGEMGGVTTELIALLSGGTGIALARALTTYIRVSRGNVRIKIKRASDGAEFDLSATNVAETDGLLARFLEEQRDIEDES